MATRYSGAVKITVVWKDDQRGAERMHLSHGGYYRAVLTTKPEGPLLSYGAKPHVVFVGAPASLRHSVDSPEAYDSAAHAALSFADDEDGNVGQHAQYTDSGWYIARTFAKRHGPTGRN